MSKWIGMTIAPAVTGRSLLESPSTQVRSLEGRPLGMSSSLMLPESSRLSLLELGSSFVTALAEQRPTDNWPHELREQGVVMLGRPAPSRCRSSRRKDAVRLLQSEGRRRIRALATPATPCSTRAFDRGRGFQVPGGWRPPRPGATADAQAALPGARSIVYTARAGIREPRAADRARPPPPCCFLAWPEVPATGRRENP
jgi:hypothetical protein